MLVQGRALQKAGQSCSTAERLAEFWQAAQAATIRLAAQHMWRAGGLWRPAQSVAGGHLLCVVCSFVAAGVCHAAYPLETHGVQVKGLLCKGGPTLALSICPPCAGDSRSACVWQCATAGEH